MTTYYLAVASDGTVFKRSTASRSYSHCVAVYSRGAWRGGEPSEGWNRSAEWAGRPELAEKAAARQRASGWRTKEGFHEVVRVEILDAVTVTAQQFKAGTLTAANWPRPNLDEPRHLTQEQFELDRD
jgi:hypothetical protein